MWQSIKRVLKQMASDKLSVAAVQKKIEQQNNAGKLQLERKKIEKRLMALTTIVRKLYEDYAAERLDEDGYQVLLKEYTQEKKNLTERMATITAKLGKTDDHAENLKKLKAIAAAYADSTELTSAMVHQLIERIEIKRAEVFDRTQVREINIVYRFVNTTL